MKLALGAALAVGAAAMGLPAAWAQAPIGDDKIELRGTELSDLGRRISEVACTGARLVSMTSPEGEIIVLLESASGGESSAVGATRACEYKFAEATKHGQWEKEINRVAAEGFRLVATLVTHKKPDDWSEWFVALMVRTAPEARYAYRILEGPHAGRIEKKLTRAAAEGFRLLPFAFHTHVREWTWALSNQHLIVVLERKEGRPGCGARLLDTRRESTMASELTEAEAAGYEAVHRREHVGHFIVFLEEKSCRAQDQ
jgi:hypothetical protein